MALALREAGLPDAPCLVFLHGLWMSSSMWQPQIERLCQNYHCVASVICQSTGRAQISDC